MEGAGEAGVVFVSLGSMVRGSQMLPHFRTLFVQVFRRLQQRVIWKFEKEVVDLPENVIVRRWLPQQDILGKGSAWWRCEAQVNHYYFLS